MANKITYIFDEYIGNGEYYDFDNAQFREYIHIDYDSDDYAEYKCLICGAVFNDSLHTIAYKRLRPQYCQNCGNRLDN